MKNVKTVLKIDLVCVSVKTDNPNKIIKLQPHLSEYLTKNVFR